MSWLVLPLLSLSLPGCRDDGPAAPPRSEAVPPTVRIYEVPAGYAQRVQSALTDLFRPMASKEDAPPVRAIVTPDGQVAVMAPAAMQAGIAGIIDGVKRAPAAATREDTFSIEYWLVAGHPAAREELGDGLGPIRKVLATIDSVDGPFAFELQTHHQIVSTDGYRAHLQAGPVSIQQSASVDPASGRVVADLVVEFLDEGSRRDFSANTRVQVEPGQVVVLASLGDFHGGGTLYFVVKPTLHDAG